MGQENHPIKAYKGMNQGMTCRSFQYAVGGAYETDRAEVCKSGFHACEYPLDVFGYYSPSTSRYFEVEQAGKIDRKCGDSKTASTKIKIGAEIGIPGFVKAAIEHTFSRAKPENTDSATGYQGAASATGYQGAASATGGRGAASATGYQGAAYAGHPGAIAVAHGVDGRAAGVLGAHIVCTEWVWDDDAEEYRVVTVEAAKVDGRKIKPGVYYTLRDGKFVEAGL